MEEGFIAYIGTELEEKDLRRALAPVALKKTDDEDENFKPRIRKSGNALFGQVILSDEDLDYALPFVKDNNQLYVANYDRDDLESIVDDYDDDYNLCYDEMHEVIPCLVEDYDETAFKMLDKKDLDCSFVCYDKKTKEFSAAKVRYGKLFYGYTPRNHEIVFSDYDSVIKDLCGKVYEFPDKSVYSHGEFHSYNKPKEKITYENPEVYNQPNQPNQRNLIFNDFASAKNLLDGLNELLVGITDTTLKTAIENAFNNYFAGLEPHKKVDDFINQNLTVEVQKKMIEIIKAEINKYNVQRQVQQQMKNVSKEIDNQIGEKVTETVNDALGKVAIPTIHIIKLGDLEIGRTNAELFHEKFDEVLSLVQLDEPVMLIGPAGSGKNHSVSQIAKALGLHMYYTNNASNEFKLTGFIDAGGNYRDTEFYKAFKNGGIFFLDEIDNSDPSALIVINSALANGYMAFPHETIDRHPDFRMVAAANTWGKGSDLQYVGRNALDGATLDRFDNVFFDYDRKLEKGLYPSEEVLSFMWSFRDAVEATKIPHIVSTRGIGKVYKKEINGIPTEDILRVNIVRNLGQDDLNTILGNMRNIDSYNKYYAQAKTLKLTK